jgi:hypothetical protein
MPGAGRPSYTDFHVHVRRRIRLPRIVFCRAETNSECSMTWMPLPIGNWSMPDRIPGGKMMNERSLSGQDPVAIRQRAEEYRTMAETARTEDAVRSLRALADRFERFAEHLETAGREGFRHAMMGALPPHAEH